jgi:DNA-binding response OmpR family regulator
MKPSIRVLSVGLQQPLDIAYGSLLMGRPCEITQVLHRGELDTIQTNEDYDVAVLGEGLSKENLIEAARLIRRRWPQANILAISSKPLNIDDTLYDDRIVSGYSAKVLVAEVLRLMGAHRRQREGVGSRWEC